MRLRIRRPWRLLALGAAATLVVVLGSQWRAAIRRNRGTADEPFRIAGNLYYVGGAGVTSFLLTGPEGHVLIDGGFPETAPAIVASIAALGFDIHDVKVLLNTHAHADHAGGLSALQETSGAELWISEGDADVIESGGSGDPTLVPLKYVGFLGLGRFPAPRVDHRFEDGDTIRLGPLALTAHVTAGHTPGCTSWSFPVRDGDRELLAVDICSLTLLPFVSLVEPETYPGIRSDFERSFSTLRSLPADIFLASHASFFDMKRKLLERPDAENPVDPFIDRTGYVRFIDRAEERFHEVLAKQR
ncbi:MAG: subclass B3 metallo-beta-lactamase [Candidatus Palauibacterales bacterium]|nr:subclass B3 metallo-beta-lactamase [Candidatus Palauibacterales bacterium]MDP2482160.1 subclass B3 metallo-beta-lactamase [Candidatus Palauibacterales bacterium]